MNAGIVSIVDGVAVVRVDLDVYGVEPLLKAAHAFTDRTHIQIEYEDDKQRSALCRIKAKGALQNIETLARDFLNETLDQTLRARLDARTEAVRNLLIAQAFSKLNLVHPTLDTAEPEDDPLGIARPDR